MDSRDYDKTPAAELPKRSSNSKPAVGADLSRGAADPQSGSLLLRSTARDGKHQDLAQPQGSDCVRSSPVDCRLPASHTTPIRLRQVVCKAFRSVHLLAVLFCSSSLL